MKSNFNKPSPGWLWFMNKTLSTLLISIVVTFFTNVSYLRSDEFDDFDNLDLSNETITSKMRKTYSSATAYDFTTAKVSATDGTCTISMTDTVSATLPEGRYVWDLTTTDSSGLITRRIEGRVTVSPSVTR